MPTYTRKEFLGLSAFLAGGVGCSGLPGTEAQETGADSGQQPDLALVNGRVYTIDDAAPQAEAFALTHGRFIAVGSTDDIRNLVGPNTEVIDAEGMTVTPGFIDTHCHPSGVNELYGVNTNLRTVAEIQTALRAKAAETPPGYWVTGFMFDDTKVVDGPLHRPISTRRCRTIRSTSHTGAGTPTGTTARRSRWRGSRATHRTRRTGASTATPMASWRAWWPRTPVACSTTSAGATS